MRIIGGKHSGRQVRVPVGLPVRPTTDFAREALFNILANRVDFENLKVLDLFSGTGILSLEFASRGAKVKSVDKHIRCISFLKKISEELDLDIDAVKADVFQYLKSETGKYDLIFADPPYELPDIGEIHARVFDKNLLAEDGTLIIEHGAKTNLEPLPSFTERRKYGNVNFSFFTGKER